MIQLALGRGEKRPFTCKYFILSVLIFGGIFSSNAGYSQKVTLIELISKTKCPDFSCFNDFITTKGFNYSNVDESSFGSLYSFISLNYIQDAPKGMNLKNQCTFMSVCMGYRCAGIETASSNYHEQLIEELAKLGFKQCDIFDSDKNCIIKEYQSKAYPKIIVFVSKSKQSKGWLSWASWSFVIHRDL